MIIHTRCLSLNEVVEMQLDLANLNHRFQVWHGEIESVEYWRDYCIPWCGFHNIIIDENIDKSSLLIMKYT